MRSDNLLIGLSGVFQKKKIKDMRLGGEYVRGRVAGSGEKYDQDTCTHEKVKRSKKLI